MASWARDMVLPESRRVKRGRLLTSISMGGLHGVHAGSSWPELKGFKQHEQIRLSWLGLIIYGFPVSVALWVPPLSVKGGSGVM